MTDAEVIALISRALEGDRAPEDAAALESAIREFPRVITGMIDRLGNLEALTARLSREVDSLRAGQGLPWPAWKNVADEYQMVQAEYRLRVYRLGGVWGWCVQYGSGPASATIKSGVRESAEASKAASIKAARECWGIGD